jgi:hypothetical protein
MGIGKKVLWAVGGLMALGVVNTAIHDLHPTSGPDPKIFHSTPLVLDNPMNSLTLKDFKTQKAGFDNVLVLSSITIENFGDIDAKDVKVRCETYGASGTKLNSGTITIYQVVKAHKTATFKNLNMGFMNTQSATADCEIAN